MHNHVNPDHAAVVHVLSAPQIAGRTAPYLRGTEPNFDGLALEAETMSGGEALLVRIAEDLWRAERSVGIVDIVRRLDSRNFARVVTAMRIARGAVIWDVVETVIARSGKEGLAA
jgi:hypothetical protein